MSEDVFQSLAMTAETAGPDAALEQLAQHLRAERRFHDLFDARLMQARRSLGLPVISSTPLDELPERTREKLEDAYLAACREVGNLLLDAGKFREAWMYLRPVGDKTAIAAALETTPAGENNLDEMIELALHEGIAPARGFALMLENFGTCNSITTLEGTIAHLARPAQTATARLLVHHLHQELTNNVRLHVEDTANKPAASANLAELVAANEWIFENDNYHIDTSHLSATVRFARLIEDDPDAIRKAWELTEYGRRLSEQFRFPGDEPFTDMYVSHGLLFAATLGERVEEALAYFREKAESVSAEQEGTAAIETYLILLARLGKYETALEEHARLVQPGMQLSPYAPRLFELATQAQAFNRFREISRSRSDLLSFTAGLVQGK